MKSLSNTKQRKQKEKMSCMILGHKQNHMTDSNP